MIGLNVFVNLLNNQYLNQYNTKLIAGFDEPFYKAATDNKPAEIQFSHDYIRSALHELGHWCVAGVERRRVDDYGYWYAADGRTQEQQNEFFKLEIKPQAIEWAFSIVCGVKFEASVDNLNNQVQGVEFFKQNLIKQLQWYLDIRFNKRVSEILRILAEQEKISPINIAIQQHLDSIINKF